MFDFDWREMDVRQREALAEWLGLRLGDRLSDGLAKYGASFSGDSPLAEARQEMLDALAYTEWVDRQLRAVSLLFHEIAVTTDDENARDLAMLGERIANGKA